MWTGILPECENIDRTIMALNQKLWLNKLATRQRLSHYTCSNPQSGGQGNCIGWTTDQPGMRLCERRRDNALYSPISDRGAQTVTLFRSSLYQQYAVTFFSNPGVCLSLKLITQRFVWRNMKKDIYSWTFKDTPPYSPTYRYLSHSGLPIRPCSTRCCWISPTCFSLSLKGELSVKQIPPPLNGGEIAQRLERERTDRKVRGSNPASASRLPLSRLGQPGSIPALVQPSGGMAARHRKGATAERLLFIWGES
ncbi:hypothetical protein CSKR_104597 [Clonorchis sinensis]|uniref:Uncharacterized protein n=1 Tax=Clonorchis sinensis TaxID=79923 RepID=A0A3R7CVM5_CLOSI|nr:hypothetical protein CSKR_104597 [Clonorchis sinensis]